MSVILQSDDVKVSTHKLEPKEIGKQHFHSFVEEIIFCLIGRIEVKLFFRDILVSLVPGESLSIEKTRIHSVINLIASISKYLIVQGVGKYDFIDHIPLTGLSKKPRTDRN